MNRGIVSVHTELGTVRPLLARLVEASVIGSLHGTQEVWPTAASL